MKSEVSFASHPNNGVPEHHTTMTRVMFPSTFHTPRGRVHWSGWYPLILWSVVTMYTIRSGQSGYMMIGVTVEAMPPPNDVCINALNVPLYEDSLSSVRLSFTNATIDTDVSSDCTDGQPPKHQGVWAKFIGRGRKVVLTSCNARRISIFRGGCDGSTRQCIAATTTPCDTGKFFIYTEPGTEYHVLVQSNSSRAIDLSIASPASGSDKCADATPLVISSNFSTIRLDTTNATVDTEVENNCIDGSRPTQAGVWVKFIGNGQKVVASTCDISLNRSISVYTGGCSSSTQQCVAGVTNASACAWVSKEFIIDTTPGIEYHVHVKFPAYDSSESKTRIELYMFFQRSPSSPTTQQAPSAPNSPQLPSAPNSPIAPSAPNSPRAPSAPNLPITPSAPNSPRTPAAPSSPMTPTIPQVPSPNRDFNTKSPTQAPSEPSCGMLGLSIFCPLQLRGVLGRIIRGIFG